MKKGDKFKQRVFVDKCSKWRPM